MPVPAIISRVIPHNNPIPVATTVRYERLGRQIPTEMMESLKIFSADAKRIGELEVKESDGAFEIDQISAEWSPKYPRRPSHFTMVDTTEGLYSHGPDFDSVQVADGEEAIHVDMITGEFDMTKPWYRRIDTLLQNMQKVVDKFRADYVTTSINSIEHNQGLLTDEFSKSHA